MFEPACYTATMILNAIRSLGLVVIVGLFLVYLAYMIGLAMVFRQLGHRPLLAFVPLYNFYRLIAILNLPTRWFYPSLVPYVGTIFSVAVAMRLGKVYGHGLAYSAVWLTYGAPLGMNMLAFSKRKPNLAILKEPPLSISQVKKEVMAYRKKHPESNPV